jgi:hypothetical protein
MFGYFDYEKLEELADVYRVGYAQKEPFPHAVIDNFAIPEKLDQVVSAFPRPGDLSWWKYDNVLEKKLAFDKVHLLPRPIKEVLVEMNSAPFIAFIEKLTGISGLIPDHHYAGGGLHQIPKGGKLGLHADFNWLRHQQLHRRVNCIVYLNKDWDESYGGHLELWDTDATKMYEKVLPVFNRMVCFNTTDFSMHGHPDPLTCPDGRFRQSLALYYYSATRPENEISASHSTIYKARPQDPKDEATEELRRRRAKGRIEDSTL